MILHHALLCTPTMCFSQLFKSTPCAIFYNHPNSNLFFCLYLFCILSNFSSFPSHFIYIEFIQAPVYHSKTKILFSFDFVISSFGYHLYTWPDCSVTYFGLETSTLQLHISSFLSSDSTLQYTTLPHFYYHLNRLLHLFFAYSFLSLKIQQISQYCVCFSYYIHQ